MAKYTKTYTKSGITFGVTSSGKIEKISTGKTVGIAVSSTSSKRTGAVAQKLTSEQLEAINPTKKTVVIAVGKEDGKTVTKNVEPYVGEEGVKTLSRLTDTSGRLTLSNFQTTTTNEGTTRSVDVYAKEQPAPREETTTPSQTSTTPSPSSQEPIFAPVRPSSVTTKNVFGKERIIQSEQYQTTNTDVPIINLPESVLTYPAKPVSEIQPATISKQALAKQSGKKILINLKEQEEKVTFRDVVRLPRAMKLAASDIEKGVISNFDPRAWSDSIGGIVTSGAKIATGTSTFLKEGTAVKQSFSQTLYDKPFETIGGVAGDLILPGTVAKAISKGKVKPKVISQKGKIESIQSSLNKDLTTVKTEDVLLIQQGKKKTLAKVKSEAQIRTESEGVLLGTSKSEIVLQSTKGDLISSSKGRTDFNIKKIETKDPVTKNTVYEIRSEGTTVTGDQKGRLTIGKFQGSKQLLPDESFVNTLKSGFSRTKKKGNPLDINVQSELKLPTKASSETIGFQKQQFEITEPFTEQMKTSLTKPKGGLKGDLTPEEAVLTLSERKTLGYYDDISLPSEGKYKTLGVQMEIKGRPIIAVDPVLKGSKKQSVISHELTHAVETRLLSKLSKPIPYKIKPNEILARLSEKRTIIKEADVLKLESQLKSKYGYGQDAIPDLDLTIEKTGVRTKTVDLTSSQTKNINPSSFEKDFLKRKYVEEIKPEQKKVPDKLLGPIIVMDDTAFFSQSRLRKYYPPKEIANTPTTKTQTTVLEKPIVKSKQETSTYLPDTSAQVLQLIPDEGLTITPRANILTGANPLTKSRFSDNTLTLQKSFSQQAITQEFKQNTGQGLKTQIKPSENVVFLKKLTNTQLAKQTNQATKTKTKARTISKQYSTLVNKQVLKAEAIQQLKQVTKQQTKQATKQQYSQKLISPSPISTYTPTIVPLAFKFKTTRSPNNFFVEIRERGLFRKAGKNFSDVGTAYRGGRRIVGSKAAASFRIRDTRTGRIITDYQGEDQTIYKSKKEKGVFIERRGKRIKSGGELKEITFKGIRSKRTKR